MMKPYLTLCFLLAAFGQASAKDVTAAKPQSEPPPIKQKTYNLGKVESTKMNAIYPGFNDSFNQAFIGLPKGFKGLEAPFYGTLAEAKEQFGDLSTVTTTYPTVLYMQGSGSFSKGPTFREWITGDLGWVFFAPNTHTSAKRPRYSSPVPKKVYEEIHKYRQAEIDQFVDRLNELTFIDKDRLFLMGNSEGALAAARYSGKEFVGRLVLSWSCEPGYYTDYPKVGAKYKTDPFLNIVGRDDVYFGKDSPYNNQVMKNPFTKREVLDFLTYFKDHRVNQK